MNVLTPETEFIYSDPVQALFADLRHGQTLSDVPTVNVGAKDQGTQMQWQARVSNGVLQQLAYQAYGCPHVLAACEWTARELTGKPIEALQQWSWQVVEQTLQVPTAKRARLLLLEDALRQLHALV